MNIDIHENRIRGGSELKQMLGIWNLNLISLQHGNQHDIDNHKKTYFRQKLKKKILRKNVKKFRVNQFCGSKYI